MDNAACHTGTKKVSLLGIMIQDIAPHKFHNEYRKDAAPVNDSPVLCFDERKMLLSVSDEGITFPTYEQIGKPEGTVYAFAID